MPKIQPTYSYNYSDIDDRLTDDDEYTIPSQAVSNKPFTSNKKAFITHQLLSLSLNMSKKTFEGSRNIGEYRFNQGHNVLHKTGVIINNHIKRLYNHTPNVPNIPTVNIPKISISSTKTHSPSFSNSTTSL